MHDQNPGMTVNWVDRRTPIVLRYLAPPDAEVDAATRENKQIFIGRILLDETTVVSFYEKPKDRFEFDFLDSTIVVERRGLAEKTFHVGELIKDQALELAYVALVRSKNGETMLVCNYAAGPTGGRQGFAVLRFTPSGFVLGTLPLTDHGKVVVFKSKPKIADVWSGTDDYLGAEADPRYYATQSCHWGGDGYECGPAKRKKGLFSPNSIMEPGIEIRP